MSYTIWDGENQAGFIDCTSFSSSRLLMMFVNKYQYSKRKLFDCTEYSMFTDHEKASMNQLTMKNCFRRVNNI